MNVFVHANAFLLNSQNSKNRLGEKYHHEVYQVVNNELRKMERNREVASPVMWAQEAMNRRAVCVLSMFMLRHIIIPNN